MKQIEHLKYRVVFVVLVYRNTQDLRDFLKYIDIKDSHTIVVNSYYDEQTEIEFKKIALKAEADFISVPNKGYGAGNNAGIEYALKHYLFDYLVVSNADIEIKDFEVTLLDNYEACIIAPRLISLSGKNQNPSSPYKPCALFEKFRYFAFKNNHTKLIWLAYAYSRLTKIIFYLLCKWRKRIFSAHGAFLIMHYEVVKRLHPLYNERMFLFNEEEHLGRKAESNEINTWYEPRIIIRHKEDGSMKVASVNEFEKARESFIEYYNYWMLNKRL